MIEGPGAKGGTVWHHLFGTKRDPVSILGYGFSPHPRIKPSSPTPAHCPSPTSGENLAMNIHGLLKASLGPGKHRGKTNQILDTRSVWPV